MPTEIELLLAQVKDPVIRENFRRIKQRLDRGFSSGGTSSGSDVSLEELKAFILEQIGNQIPDELWTKREVVVPGDSETIVVDSMAQSTFRAIKYFITAYNSDAVKTKAFEMTVVNQFPEIETTVFGKIGSVISHEIDANIVSGQMRVNFKNNESYELRLIIARMIL